MLSLPIALSLPHAGLEIPVEVYSLCRLSLEEIRQDGDEGSQEIAAIICPFVAVSTEAHIARAFVDMNREEIDISPDGVVKTHTCRNAPIYSAPLPSASIEALISAYHRPYHATLSGFAQNSSVRMGIDLHTMAEYAPPIAPVPGVRRPRICIGNAHHTAAPSLWVETLAEIASRYVDPDVTINTPFSGGWITQSHGREMPWIQLEVSREPWISDGEKGEAILEMLRRFVEVMRF